MTSVAHPPNAARLSAQSVPPVPPGPDPRFERPAPPPAPAASPAISVGEAARYTGLSPKTIRRRFQDGLIPGNFVKRRLVLNRAAVEALVPPAAPAPSAYERALDAVSELGTHDDVDGVVLACLERIRAGGLR